MNALTNVIAAAFTKNRVPNGGSLCYEAFQQAGMLPKPPLPPLPTATTSHGLLDIDGCWAPWLSKPWHVLVGFCPIAHRDAAGYGREIVHALLLPAITISLETATRLLEAASLDNSSIFGRAAAVSCRLRFRLKWPTNWLSFLMEVPWRVDGIHGRSLCKALSPCRIRSTIHVSCLGDETRRPSIPSTWLWETSLRTRGARFARGTLELS